MTALHISKNNLFHNIREIEKTVGNSKLIGVVKGNGYGLDTLLFTRALIEGGVSTLAVARIQDAVILREGGIDSEIILLTPVSTPAEALLAAEHRLTCTIDSISCALLLNTAAKENNIRLWIHIKIDTGFGRYGFAPDCVNEVKQIISGCDFLTITGIFSHLSNAFGKKETATKIQYDKLMTAVNLLEKEGLDVGMKHLANSFGALRFPYTRLDAVRIGSALTGRITMKAPTLKNVCTLLTEISEIRWLPKGANIGYANVYKTKCPTKIAIIPLGYADGFCTEKSRDTFRFLDVLRYLFADFRCFFEKKHLTCIINGKKCNLLGRVGLTNSIVDVTNVECNVNDTVLFDVNPLLIRDTILRNYD